MNNELESKLTRFKNVQNKLSKVADSIRNEDKSSINEVWKDKNSELFLDALDNVCTNIDSLIIRIDDSIKEISRISNNGGVL